MERLLFFLCNSTLNLYSIKSQYLKNNLNRKINVDNFSDITIICFGGDIIAISKIDTVVEERVIINSTNKSSFYKSLRRNKLFLLFSICILLIFCIRLMFTVCDSDEVFNLAQAYRITLGQKMFVEIWDMFQTGDSFMVPFVWLFTRITGGTEGIVLFSRFVYLFLNILLTVTIYYLLKGIIDKKILFYTGLFLITYAPFSLYYLWYDTCLLLFMLLGLMLIIAYLNSGKKNLLLLAGITHALMCFSYPTSIIVYCFMVLLLAAYKLSQKESLKEIAGSLKYYIIGATVVFAVFIVYVMVNGLGNMFFTDSEILNSNLTGRTRSIYTALRSAVLSAIGFYSIKKLLLTVLIMIAAFLNMKKQNSYIKAFLLCYILISSVLFNYGLGSMSLIGFFFYLSIWAPALYFNIDKDQLTSKIKNQLFIFLWLPSLASTACVGYTAFGNGIKTIFGMYAGAVCSFIFFNVIAKGLPFKVKNFKSNLLNSVAICLIAANLFLYSTATFHYPLPIDCRHQMASGIFKGLVVKEEDSRFEKMQAVLEENVEKKDKTIMCSESMKWCYLVTDLKPDTYYLWAPQISDGEKVSYKMTFLYFDKFYGKPDIIIWAEKDKKYMTDDLLSMLQSNYMKTYEYPAEFAIFKLK